MKMIKTVPYTIREVLNSLPISGLTGYWRKSEKSATGYVYVLIFGNKDIAVRAAVYITKVFVKPALGIKSCRTRAIDVADISKVVDSYERYQGRPVGVSIPMNKGDDCPIGRLNPVDYQPQISAQIAFAGSRDVLTYSNELLKLYTAIIKKTNNNDVFVFGDCNGSDTAVGRALYKANRKFYVYSVMDRFFNKSIKGLTSVKMVKALASDNVVFDNRESFNPSNADVKRIFVERTQRVVYSLDHGENSVLVATMIGKHRKHNGTHNAIQQAFSQGNQVFFVSNVKDIYKDYGLCCETALKKVGSLYVGYVVPESTPTQCNLPIFPDSALSIAKRFVKVEKSWPTYPSFYDFSKMMTEKRKNTSRMLIDNMSNAKVKSTLSGYAALAV